jgi:hypothetical protein
MANAVYDPETGGEQRDHLYNPDPKDNKPSGDPSDPRTIHKNQSGPKSTDTGARDIRDAESSGDSPYNPQGEEAASRPSSPQGLANAESLGSKGSSGAGGGFKFNKEDNSGGRLNNALKMVAKHKKGIGAGVGAGGGVAAIGLSVFFLLVPLKIEHIVQNLENRFFSTSESAVDRESRKMFTRYIAQHVLPGYRGKCGTTIEKGCRPVGLTGNNPVTHMYRTWADARLENKLAENYGIEFKYDTQSKKWYMKAPGTNPNGDDIGPNGGGLDTDFERHDRASLRAAVSDAFEHETRWKKVMYRYKVGRLLEEKYGLRRCIIFCGTRDALADKLDAKKKAAKLKLVQRVITPRFETLGTVMECLITSCDPTKTQPIPAEDGSTSELAGNPENPETDSKIREDGNRIAARFAGESADDMLSALKTIQEKGYQRYLLEKVLEKVGLGELSKSISDAAPIVGWVNRAAAIISLVDHAGPIIKKLGYLANAGAAVKLYMMYRSYADEVHTGHVDATEVGSLTDSLGPGDKGTSTDPQVGGTAGAEDTPLYANLIDNKPSGSPTAFNGLLPAKAYAASSNNGPSDYKCSDNKPVPSGKLVCSEEVFGGGNGYLNSVHNTLHTAPLSYITDMANAWSGTIGKIFQAVGDVFGWIINNIPGLGGLVNDVTSFIAKIAQPFFNFLTNKLIPNPFSTNMSGGRTFDLMAGGADVAGNDYAHTGLGGKMLSPQQVADIVNQQQDQARTVFDHRPFFARMFDTSSEYSLITKVAMSIPIGSQAQAQKGLANLLNPLGSMGHGFASIFTGRAVAAVTTQPDPFGVVQYGYTSDDLNKVNDPETYWDLHCSDNAANAYMKNNSWNKAAAHYNTNSPDDPSGMPVNTTTNPCLLIKATVGAAGGLFDTSNLTTDDLTDDTGSSGAGTTAPSGSTVPPGGIPFPFPPTVGVVPPSSWTEDQGVDISTLNSACGKDAPEVALGNGVIVGRGISGFGPDAPILHITDGPLNGRYIYYGHAGDLHSSNGAGRPPNTDVGDSVQAGQVITYTGCGIVGLSSGPHLEIGIWPKGSSPDSTFPAMNQTSGEMIQILKQAYAAQGNK